MCNEYKSIATGAALGILGAGLFYLAFCDKPEPASPPKKKVASVALKEKKDLTKQNPVPKELSLNESASGVFFGKHPNEHSGYIGKPAELDGHILVVGGPGSGKTSSIAEPTALTWKGSTISLMIKGDHHRRIQKLQEEGRRVIVFDPSRLEENPTRYDVFSLLNRYPAERISNASAIAAALLPMPEETREPIWIQAGQAFLTAAILYYNALGCSFPEMIRAITTASIPQTIETILQSGYRDAAAFASRLSDIDTKLKDNVGFELVSLSTFRSPHIMTAFSESADSNRLDWEELNHATEPLDIILLIPEAKIDLWAPMLTIMLEQMIRSLMNRPERTYSTQEELPPLLISLDEFARLGKLPSITSGLATLRSRGCTLLLMVQCMSALDLIYGQDAAALIQANCSFKIVLDVTEPKGQRYFSDLIGSTATMDMSTNSSANIGASLPFSTHFPLTLSVEAKASP